MGQAISKTVGIAEIIKVASRHCYQLMLCACQGLLHAYQGSISVEMTRHVSMISITLSTRELNKNYYQAPYHVEPSKPQPNYMMLQQRQQQPKQARVPYNALNEDSYNGGQRRGRGRGRGWCRGGYGNYPGGYGNYQGGYGNNQGSYGNYQGGYGNYQDNDGYSNRGRGWGYSGTGFVDIKAILFSAPINYVTAFFVFPRFKYNIKARALNSHKEKGH
ncbi:hypothetical protein FNV43_RR23099 [Rhamnella rubrinervis]|uniref:Uncharacterized protein n=1 Tax=Rhamnella rubrinervis TaxID=2594499 RepID=A0A8K0DRD2_9ROSA|nr:hypothetical protein FNV43_RR23099 [Rhamnella rubrinervis]